MDPDMVLAEIDDLTIDSVIFVRGRCAQVVSLEFPLVFWRFIDEGADGPVRHRSFISSRELFQVSSEQRAALQNMHASPASDFDESDDWASFDENHDPINSSVFSTPVSEASGGAGNTVSAFQFASDPTNIVVEQLDDFEFAPAAIPLSMPAAPSPADAEADPAPSAPLEAPPPPAAAHVAFSPFAGRAPKVLCIGERARTLSFDALSMAQGLHLEQCVDCVVSVGCKINSISINRCTNLVLRFAALISACDVINSRRVRVVCLGTGSTFTVEGSECVALHFPATLPEVMVTTAAAHAVFLIASPQPGAHVPTAVDDLIALDAAAARVDEARAAQPAPAPDTLSALEAAADAAWAAAQTQADADADAEAEGGEVCYRVPSLPVGEESDAELAAAAAAAPGPGGLAAGGQQMCKWDGAGFRTQRLKREGLAGYVTNFQD